MSIAASDSTAWPVSVKECHPPLADKSLAELQRCIANAVKLAVSSLGSRCCATAGAT